MKIDRGMYARTKSKIIKINQIIENGIREFEDDYGRIFEEETGKRVIRYIDKDGWNCGLDEDDILKASHNIIDLIEEGDYVNGYKVLEIVKGFKVIVDKLELNTRDGNYYLKQFTNNEIKSIVTKEQHENNCYKVDDK